MHDLTLAHLLAEPAPLCWDRLMATNAPVAEPGGVDPWPDAGRDETGTDDDPMTLALPWMVRHMGVAQALATVMGPDPVDLFGASDGLTDNRADNQADRHGHSQAAAAGENDPHLLSRSAQVLPVLQRLGHDTRLVRCPVEQWPELPLPAVLILRGGDACVMTRHHQPRHGLAMVNVVMPGCPPLAFDLPVQAVAKEYAGMALLTRPLAQGAAAAAQPPDHAGGAMASPPGAGHRGPLARLLAQLQAARALVSRSPAPCAGTTPPRRSARPTAWLAERFPGFFSQASVSQARQAGPSWMRGLK